MGSKDGEQSEWYNNEMKSIEKSNYSKKTIKTAGINLTDKIQLKYKVIEDADDEQSLLHKEKDKKCCTDCKVCCGNCWIRFTIWRHSFKNFEATYGSGVVSYFDFLKTMFLLNLLLSLIIGVFIILPQGLNYGETYQNSTLDQLKSSTDNASKTAYTCSLSYISYMNSYEKNASILTYVQDFFQGTGIFEEGILFIGYYFPGYIQVVGLEYNMSLAYILTLGAVYIVILVFMLIKTGKSFKQAVLASATTSNELFCQIAFSTWDYSLMDETNVDLNNKMMRNLMISEIDVKQHKDRHENGTCGQKTCTVIKRILINILILGLLGGGGYAIYYAQQQSTEYTTANKSSSSTDFVYLLYSYLPAITVALVGAVLPAIFELLVRLEDYMEETAIFLTILRTLVVNLASLAMIMVSIFETLLCDSKNSCNIGQSTCTAITCWETYVGQEFYKIAIMFLLVAIIKAFLVDFIRGLIGRHCTCKLASLIGPPEFLIPKHTLEVLSSQLTLWFGIFFCPLLAPITALTLFIIFYLKKFGCHFSYRPSERPFKASRATMFFMIASFLAYFLCILPVGFLITQISASRSCSPYRQLSTVYEIIPLVISGFPDAAQDAINFISSPEFLYFLAVLLIIIAYYYSVLAAAEKEKLEMHEKALNEEGQKKLFWISSTEKTHTNPSAATQRFPPWQVEKLLQLQLPDQVWHQPWRPLLPLERRLPLLRLLRSPQSMSPSNHPAVPSQP